MEPQTIMLSRGQAVRPWAWWLTAANSRANKHTMRDKGRKKGGREKEKGQKKKSKNAVNAEWLSLARKRLNMSVFISVIVSVVKFSD